MFGLEAAEKQRVESTRRFGPSVKNSLTLQCKKKQQQEQPSSSERKQGTKGSGAPAFSQSRAQVALSSSHKTRGSNTCDVTLLLLRPGGSAQWSSPVVRGPKTKSPLYKQRVAMTETLTTQKEKQSRRPFRSGFRHSADHSLIPVRLWWSQSRRRRHMWKRSFSSHGFFVTDRRRNDWRWSDDCWAGGLLRGGGGAPHTEVSDCSLITNLWLFGSMNSSPSRRKGRGVTETTRE